MLHLLRRHPFPVVAHFRYSFVLTYALPEEDLKPLLAPGLTLDTYNGWGFVAIAMVQTEKMRPAFFPRFLGQSFFLVGYRIFARYQTLAGRNLRGLQILRSETDKPLMVMSGNLFTHYNYHAMRIHTKQEDGTLNIAISVPKSDPLYHTRSGYKFRLRVTADVSKPATDLPPGSPFPDWAAARRFAGPMPFTFVHERESHSIIRVQGRRKDWNPMPVSADVPTLPFTLPFFFRDPHGPWGGRDVSPVLASAFYIPEVPYRWDKGIREELPR